MIKPGYRSCRAKRVYTFTIGNPNRKYQMEGIQVQKRPKPAQESLRLCQIRRGYDISAFLRCSFTGGINLG